MAISSALKQSACLTVLPWWDVPRPQSAQAGVEDHLILERYAQVLFSTQGRWPEFRRSERVEVRFARYAERAAVRAAALIIERESDEISGWFEFLDESGNLQVIIPLQTVLLAKAA